MARKAKMHCNNNLECSEPEKKYIRLMLDVGAQGSEVNTSCERLVASLRKRRVTPEDLLEDKGVYQLKHELLQQTIRANKIQAEFHELQIQHTRQVEYSANLKPFAVTGRLHWTKWSMDSRVLNREIFLCGSQSQ